MRNTVRYNQKTQRGSTLVIVLWIAFGLVSLTLYFAQSMSSELRASDNRVCGLAAEHAIEGAARYVSYVLSNLPTNGIIPDPSTYLNEAVPVGEAHFWLIGRDTNNPPSPDRVFFSLVPESSKLNLNTASSNMLFFLPGMSIDLTTAILDWRDTNGGSISQTYYSMNNPPYQCKASPFETVDELRLVYGADMDSLVGEDINSNGVLDPTENDVNHNGLVDPGLLECLTVYSREPNTNADGSVRVNIRTVSGTGGDLASLIQTNLSQGRAEQILNQLGLGNSAPARNTGGRGNTGGPGGTGAPVPPAVTISFSSPLDFYRKSGMTLDEFALIANKITVSTGAYIEGRINVNTASPAVLSCLPGISDTPNLAQTLVNYRAMNPTKLTSVAWIVDALGQSSNSTLDTLAASDCITTLSYQFTADVAALGPHGRGYRRVRFVFDTCDGTTKIVYRQDLSHLGWALGKAAYQNWLLAKNSR
jgi:DNA uptake protein ComE-like DNA-binding protein